ncbi:MAG: DUF6146 family protein [Bacteroidales bacterium]
MRRLVLVTILIVALAGPDLSGQDKKERVKSDTLEMKRDSIEYELIIFDTGFDTWLAMKPSKNFYSNEYYRQKNIQYVREWNNRFMNPRRYGSIYENYIDFDPMIDYGKDLNYKLYYYFRYFEQMNGVKLIPGRR